MKPFITDYTKILHQYGVNSIQSKEFKSKHSHNKLFIKRASVMDLVFRFRDQTTETER